MSLEKHKDALLEKLINTMAQIAKADISYRLADTVVEKNEAIRVYTDFSRSFSETLTKLIDNRVNAVLDKRQGVKSTDSATQVRNIEI